MQVVDKILVFQSAADGGYSAQSLSGPTIVRQAMKDRLGPEEQALRRAVGEVLHYLWDPIGVSGSVQARDEYDGYADHVCSLLWQGADAVQISKRLVQLAEQNMGLPDTQGRADLAARKLLGWRDAANASVRSSSSSEPVSRAA